MKRLRETISNSKSTPDTTLCKVQKTSEHSVEVTTNEKRITPANNLIESNNKSLHFLDVFSHDEMLDNLLHFFILSAIPLSCTNRFLNQNISIIMIRRLTEIYYKNNPLPQAISTNTIPPLPKCNMTPFDGLNRIFSGHENNVSNNLSTTIAFYLSAYKYIHTLKDKLINLPPYTFEICQKFVQFFAENFQNHFSKKFESIFVDLLKMPEEMPFYKEFEKSFIASQFADKYCTSRNLLTLYSNAKHLTELHNDDKFVTEIMDFFSLVFQFQAIKKNGDLNDLFITAYEECIWGNNDGLSLLNQIANYDSSNQYYVHLNVDFLNSAITLMKAIFSDGASWETLFKVVSIIYSYICSQEDLNEDEEQCFHDFEQVVFTFLKELATSNYEDRFHFLAIIVEILNIAAQSGIAFTDDEWSLLGNIATDLINEYNANTTLTHFRTQGLTMFSNIFELADCLNPEHIKFASNAVFKIIIDSKDFELFYICEKIIQHLLTQCHSLEKEMDFKIIKYALLKIGNSENNTMGYYERNYRSLLSCLIENKLIKLNAQDCGLLKNQLFISIDDLNEQTDLSNLVIEEIFKNNIKHTHLIISIIIGHFHDIEYQILKEKIIETIKNPLEQRKSTFALLLLNLHKNRPMLNEDEMSFILEQRPYQINISS